MQTELSAPQAPQSAPVPASAQEVSHAVPPSAPLGPRATAVQGIALKLTSVVLFVIMAALLKAASVRVPAGELVFFRAAFGTVPIIVWLVWMHHLPGGLVTHNPVGHIWRGIIGTGAMGLNFAALAFLALPTATAIGFAAPILAVIFAALLLGEKVRIIRMSAVMMGMTGVLIILWPNLTGTGRSGENNAIGAMFALGGAVMGALAQIQIRRLATVESTTSIVFWFHCFASVASLLTLPFGWVWPTPTEAVLLVGAGLLGGSAQLFMTAAYRQADASLLAPFDYTAMVFALVFGYVFFAELPTLTTLLGSAVVISAGVLIIWREHQLGLERRRHRKSMTPHG